MKRFQVVESEKERMCGEGEQWKDEKGFQERLLRGNKKNRKTGGEKMEVWKRI